MPPRTPTRDQEVPRLHDDAPKRAMTQHATAVETEWSRVFTRSPSAEKVPTMVPPRGLRHPRAPSPLMPKRRAFAREKSSYHTRYCEPPKAPSQVAKTRTGSRHCRSTASARISLCQLHTTHVDREDDHNHCHVTRRRVTRADHLPGPPPRHPRSHPQGEAGVMTTVSHERTGRGPNQPTLEQWGYND